MSEHEIPERLARFSALLAERGIVHEVGDPDDPDEPRDFLTIDYGADHLVIHADGEWWLPDHSEPIWPSSPITTAIALSREVWSP